MVAVADKPTLLRFERGQDVRSHDTDRGSIWVWRLSPSVYVSSVRGHMDRGMAQLIIDVAEPLYKNGPVSGFHDWFGMIGYDTSSRVDLTSWVMRHREATRLFIGLRSKLVAMGVSVANLALGDVIKTCSSTSSLENALEQALRE